MKTQKVYLEHANISVSNLDNAVNFFKAAFPHFRIRGGGKSDFGEWLHIGDDITYVALTQGHKEPVNNHPDYEENGINHIGFVVKDVSAIANRLLTAGFERNYPKQIQQYRIRDYFADTDGNQYEFVEYLSEKPEERNSYEN